MSMRDERINPSDIPESDGTPNNDFVADNGEPVTPTDSDLSGSDALNSSEGMTDPSSDEFSAAGPADTPAQDDVAADASGSGQGTDTNQAADPKPPKPPKAPKDTPPKNPYGFFKKKRSGVPMTKEEIKQIKEGRKKLRKDLRAMGEKSRKEFEITASSLGLYFDKNKHGSMLRWFFATKAGWILLGSALVLLVTLFAISMITQMKGHFTINMSKDMFRQGFSISESKDFKVPTSHLFSTPAVDVPCVSIVDIPDNVNDIDGEHNGESYFAYTFYLKNEGEQTADYDWELRLASESMSVSKAAWVMLFVDDEMTIYASPDDEGTPQALPVRGNDTVGYLSRPFYDVASDRQGQYEIVRQDNSLTYWRIITKPFYSSAVIAAGERIGVLPGDVHKFTVVVWLEGDDPDCTSDLIGGHLGLEFFFALADEHT